MTMQRDEDDTLSGGRLVGRTAMTAVLLLGTLPFGASAEVYRWTDADGRVHFGDKPPRGADTEQVEIRINTYQSPQIVQPPAGRDGPDVGGDRRVVMYSAEWCGVCKRAAAYFRDNRIPFTEYDVEKSAKGRADFKRLGARGVPVILVGKGRLNGFSERGFEALYRR